MKTQPSPPRLFLHFFRWYCHPKLAKHIEGDLMEVYHEQLRTKGKTKADIQFVIDVLLLVRPGIIRSRGKYQAINNTAMFKNYVKIGWRNLLKNKGYSFINIGGLSASMVVAALISLWIYDELTTNKYHLNYERIAQVMQHSAVNGGTVTFSSLPMPTSAAIRAEYGEDFKNVASTWTGEQIVAYEDKVFTKIGCYSESSLPEILTLEMIHGTRTALEDNSSILLSESLAKILFGDLDPISKQVKINNTFTQQVGGVYKDIPKNSTFYGIAFMAPIRLLFSNGTAMDNWQSSSFQIIAEINPKNDIKVTSYKIKDILYKHTKDATRPVLFLNPMSRWHLYEFKNGESVSGRLQYVWLVGIIGSFVLFLACINFMNLSTARSEKRAKEVGIRKAIGSVKMQLVTQFLSEAFLVVTIAFSFTVILTAFSLPWFNELSGKQVAIPWSNSAMWAIIVCFIVGVSVLAGSYPAFYLSSFKPIRVLKGTFKTDRFSVAPRKVLVVTQFTVSVVLIIGTLMVYNQIQYAKNRPVGYDRSSLISIPLLTKEIQQQYDAFRHELLRTNGITNVSRSSSPTTGIWSSADNLEWKGKDPNTQSLFGTISIDPEFGDVVNWEITAGRNFSNSFASDSQAFIFNKAAILQMGLKEPLGESVTWHGKNWNVIGVVNDMVMTSPFAPTMPTVFLIDSKERPFNIVHIKLSKNSDTRKVLSAIEEIFKKFTSTTPFNYKFVDQEYAMKFAGEERIGKIASAFATLAIIINCLGLYGLASFIAEQRTKEVGIRKILGASLFNIWGMLSKDFVVLIAISLIIAIPISYYSLLQWLQNYDYRAEISWWIFLAAGGGALCIALLTVSYQAIRAALMNPVKSLRSE
ncbi:FtsX-like permease family protein [Chryseolinea sp. H1M3-3]|uniref:FtsX-like permease family protein n=1 Tax=Chryseolinea sp. H1M3-3 TaxID=3034144 RepID=UPI0023EBCFE8|nr:FtsX-like permease family protein [Chryseolinea sp. H1M3-3]